MSERGSCILFLSHIIIIIFSWLWNKIWVVRLFPQNQKPLQLSTTCWFTVHVWTNNLAIKILSVTEGCPPACAAECGMRSAAGPATPVWGPVARNLPSVWTGSERTHAGWNKTLLIRKIFSFLHALGMFGCCWKIIIYPGLQSISFIRIQHTSNGELGSIKNRDSNRIPFSLLDTECIPLWFKIKWESSSGGRLVLSYVDIYSSKIFIEYSLLTEH